MEKSKKVSLALTVGTVITYGALGFTGALGFAGALAFSKLLIVCGTAFVFSGFVEGQVFWEKIAEAIDNFFDDNYLQRSILRKKLQLLINNQELENNLFMAEYRRTCQYLIQLYNQQGQLTDEAHQQIDDLSNRIKNMENFLLKWIQKKQKNDVQEPLSEMEESILKLISANGALFNDIDQMAANKKLALFIGGTLCIGAGIGSYFATIGAINMGLGLLGISLAGGLFGIVFAIVLFGAAGYALSLYQSISEVVKKYTFDDLCQKISNFFIEANWSKRLAMALVIGLTVFAVLATAGTWFKLINNGASLVPMINKIASVIQFFSIILMAIPSFIYSFVNSCDSFNKIETKWSDPKKWEKLKENWQLFCGQVKNIWQSENLIQFINPFRALTYVLEGLIFFAHLASMAVGNDQFPEKISSTIAGIAVEGFADSPALFPEDNGAENTTQTNGPIELDQLDDKHHNHSEFFTDVVLFIPRCVGTLWDWALGSLWFYLVTDLLQDLGWSTKAITAPSWQAARDKFFTQPATHQTSSFQSSDAWVAQELMEHCDQHKENYAGKSKDPTLIVKLGIIDQTKKKLSGTQKQSLQKQKLDDYQAPGENVHNVLEQNKAIHRNYLFDPFPPTKSIKFIDKVKKNYYRLS